MFAIARNLLLKKKDEKVEFTTGDITQFQREEGGAETDPERQLERETQINVVVGCLELLEEDCNRLLRFSFFEKRTQSEIAAQMGYSEAFVKVKKYRCLEYLRKKVIDHPLFRHLKNPAT